MQTMVFMPILALSIIGVIHSWTHKRQQALVMPTVAQVIGLHYKQDAGVFVSHLPKKVLPERGVQLGKHHVTALLGSHEFQMSELSVVTGSKGENTLFRGIAASFPNRTPLPAFFLFQDRKTRTGAIVPRELSTDGLHHLRDVTSARRTYGIWTSSPLAVEPPALSIVVDCLLRLEERLGQGYELYSASSSGKELHLLLSYNRDLFRVGGTFQTEARLFKHVQAAMKDLNIPLTLAQALIEAEAVASAKS